MYYADCDFKTVHVDRDFLAYQKDSEEQYMQTVTVVKFCTTIYTSSIFIQVKCTRHLIIFPAAKMVAVSRERQVLKLKVLNNMTDILKTDVQYVTTACNRIHVEKDVRIRW